MDLEPFAKAGQQCPYHQIWCTPRQYDDAIDHFAKMNDLFTRLFYALKDMAIVYAAKNMPAEAARRWRRLTGKSNSNTRTCLARLWLSRARPEASKLLQEIEQISKRECLSLLYCGAYATGLSDKESAFEWLDTAVQQRDPWMIHIKVKPEIDILRSDPRFRDLLRRMKLSP